MLQEANTVLFNPLVPKAHNSECQNQSAASFTNQASKSQFKVKLAIFFILPPRPRH